MRKILPVITVLLTVAVLATGCDFFRKLAGRPTSSDIEAIREAIRQREAAAAQAVQDTVKAVQDTVPAAVPGPAPAPSPAPQAGQASARYYVIVASFSKEENAMKCAERMAARGYPGELLKFKGGFTAVGICGTDDAEEARNSLKEIKRQDFCPEGVWILDRNRK